LRNMQMPTPMLVLQNISDGDEYILIDGDKCVKPERGVKQGCLMNPQLFLHYTSPICQKPWGGDHALGAVTGEADLRIQIQSLQMIWCCWRTVHLRSPDSWVG
jgi:hypothetical protein